MSTDTARMFQVMNKDGAEFIRPIGNKKQHIVATSIGKAIYATMDLEEGWLTQIGHRWFLIVSDTGRVRPILLADTHYIYIEDSQERFYQLIND